MKFALTLTAALFALTLTSAANAGTIKSEIVNVKASRITERVVLVDKAEKSLRVQIIQEFLAGSTDVSNTSRLILAISQLGEMNEIESSFVLTETMGLRSAKRLSGGVYQITHMDARAMDSGKLEVTQTIDAREAINKVMKFNCEEFGTCEVPATVTLK